MVSNTPPQKAKNPRSIQAETLSLVGLSIPLVLGLATATAPALVDTYMLGDLGETVLAAVSLTSSALLIFYAGLYGLVVPLGIQVGRAYGAGNAEAVSGYVWHGCLVALVAGLLSLGLMAVGRSLLAYAAQPPAVMAIITPYWVVMSLSLLPFVLALVFKQVYDSIDRPWVGFGFTIVAVIGNVVLNWLLIDGNLGFPALGLLGAGIGSFGGQLIGLVLIGAHYLLAPSMRPYRAPLRWSRTVLDEQLGEGGAVSLQYMLESGAVTVAGIMIGWLGATELAANQIVNAVTGVLYMLPLGMATAVGVRVAQAAGAGATQRVRRITYIGLALVTACALVFTALLLLTGREIAAAFVTDTQVIVAAAATFAAVGLMQVFDGLQSVSLGALRGLMDNRWPTFVSLIGYWVIALPAAYVGGVVLAGGAAGVWLGFALGLVFASIMLFARLRHQLQRQPVSLP